MIVIFVSAVAGCSGRPDAFVIEDPHGIGRSAVLKLCGAEQPLARRGQALVGEAQTPCEERGQVVVTYKDGRTVDCLVGKVTPKAKLEWRFQLHTSWCEELSANAGIVS